MHKPVLFCIEKLSQRYKGVTLTAFNARADRDKH